MIVKDSKLQKINRLIKEREKKIKNFEREIDIINFWSMAKKYGFLDGCHIPNLEKYRAMKEFDEQKDIVEFNMTNKNWEWSVSKNKRTYILNLFFDKVFFVLNELFF